MSVNLLNAHARLYFRKNIFAFLEQQVLVVLYYVKVVIGNEKSHKATKSNLVYTLFGEISADVSRYIS